MKTHVLVPARPRRRAAVAGLLLAPCALLVGMLPAVSAMYSAESVDGTSVTAATPSPTSDALHGNGRGAKKAGATPTPTPQPLAAAPTTDPLASPSLGPTLEAGLTPTSAPSASDTLASEAAPMTASPAAATGTTSTGTSSPAAPDLGSPTLGPTATASDPALAAGTAATPIPTAQTLPLALGRTAAYDFNTRLAKTANFCGNLEFDNPRRWTAAEFDAAKAAGFTAVRLCVTWEGHTQTSSPFAIDPGFLAMVEEAVTLATDRGIAVVVNAHYDTALVTDPAASRDRFLATWRQIATAFASRGPLVALEPFNEPHGALSPGLWNQLLADTVATIRQVDPVRILVVDTAEYAGLEGLGALQLPDDDRLIVSTHTYAPFAFTHQGAPWVSPIPPTGVAFPAPGIMPIDMWDKWSSEERQTTTLGTAGVTISPKLAGSHYWLARTAPVLDGTAVRFTVDRDMWVKIQCWTDPRGAWPTGTTVFAKGGQPTVVEAGACGATAGLGSIMLTASGSTVVAPWTINDITVVARSGDWPALGTDVQRAQAPVRHLAAWGRAADRPVFLGEFGTYRAAPHADRVVWTARVREAAEAEGIPWGLWDFDGGGFSVYSRFTGAWDVELLRAALPGTTVG